MQRLLYLANTFDSMNSLNVSMQGAAYYEKLILWKSYMARDECDMFPELTKYICCKEVNIKQTIIGHLEQLARKFVDYCGDALSPTNENDWIIDPFAGTELPQLPIHVAEEFIEITSKPTNHISLES